MVADRLEAPRKVGWGVVAWGMTWKGVAELVAEWKNREEEAFLAAFAEPILIGLGELDAGLIKSSKEDRSTWFMAMPVGGDAAPRAEGALAGAVIPVVGKNGPEQREILIGRSPFCDIFLDDEAVSELHCQLELEGERLAATDQGSTNGTMINGDPLEPEVPCPLQNEDVLTVGRHSFQFFTPRVLFQYMRLGLIGG